MVAVCQFLTGTSLCDHTDHKLVFYDDFNGNTLSSNWLPYLTWDEMNNGNGDNDNWAGAHGDGVNDKYQFRPEDVVVANGYCHLLLKNEHLSWHCASCADQTPRITNLTGAIIETPFRPNGNTNYFNSGKFEARIKFPNFNHAHCTFWTWHGVDPGGINEIDIAEAYGEGNPSSMFDVSHRAHVNRVTHAWVPDPPNADYDYRLPKHTVDWRYPMQEWWRYQLGDELKIDAFHVYGCEWDPNVVKVFLDGHLAATYWKYCQTHSYQLNWLFGIVLYHYNVGSGCHPDAGVWKVTEGFPYNNFSDGQLRLTATVDDIDGDPNSVSTLGEMDVDYVKIWQRHPEQDGHALICNDNINPTISGMPVLCTAEFYSATPAITGGQWSGLGIAALNNYNNYGGQSVAQFYKPLPGAGQGIVTYTYPTGPAGICPLDYVSLPVFCYDQSSGGWNPNNFVVHTMSYSLGSFQLFVPENLVEANLNRKFEWTISYLAGNNSDTQSIHTFGRYVSTPAYELSGNQNYYIHWNVKMMDSAGTILTSWEGNRTNADPYGQQSEDTSLYFYDAIITDSSAYLNDVAGRIGSIYLPPDVDSADINNLIEKSRVAALAPYILQKQANRNAIVPPSNSSVIPTETEETQIYPNPTAGLITIVPGKAFISKEPIDVKVYDLVGNLKEAIKYNYTSGNKLTLSLEGLTSGTYILKMMQKNRAERFKVVR